MIHCNALKEQSMFVTAKGDILPCCYMYRGGPKLTDNLKEIIKEENFEGLVKSWTSQEPFHMCAMICGEGEDDPNSMKSFNKQWKIQDDSKT